MRIIDWSSDVCSSDRAGALPASGQENPPAASAPDSYQAPEGPPTEDSTETAKPESKFHRMFFDETDGKLDFSRLLEKGGFFPMPVRSEEHTSELQSLMRLSYAVFCLKKKNTQSLQ